MNRTCYGFINLTAFLATSLPFYTVIPACCSSTIMHNRYLITWFSIHLDFNDKNYLQYWIIQLPLCIFGCFFKAFHLQHPYRVLQTWHFAVIYYQSLVCIVFSFIIFASKIFFAVFLKRRFYHFEISHIIQEYTGVLRSQPPLLPLKFWKFKLNLKSNWKLENFWIQWGFLLTKVTV